MAYDRIGEVQFSLFYLAGCKWLTCTIEISYKKLIA